MKIFKMLLSLHSIKLILISVFVITYLIMTAPNSSNKTEVFLKEGSTSIASEESKSLGGDNAESMEAKKRATQLLPNERNKIKEGDKNAKTGRTN